MCDRDYSQIISVKHSDSRRRINGKPPSLPKVRSLLERISLVPHKDTLVINLSGGNRRKLSTAVALIGNPKVVLLDEPSTGIDVGARRFLWDLLDEVRRGGQTIILTSHSMEECEVLCTRVGIMRKGRE